METEAPFPYVDKLHKKRKRFFIQGCNLSDHLEEDDGFDDQGNAQFEILDDLNQGYQNSVVRKVLNRGTHKVVITEEIVNEALKDLHMDDESVESKEKEKLVLSEQLKNSIEILEKQEKEYIEKFLKTNISLNKNKNMQLIPWISKEVHINNNQKLDALLKENQSSLEENDIIPSSSEYKVEEPSEVKNPLKRTHSEANKLNVEEIKSLNDQNYKTELINSFGYIVELAAEDEESKDSSLEVENCHHQNVNFNITELPDTKHRKSINEEKMDM